MSQFFWKEDLSELAAGNDEYAAFNRRIVNTKKQVLGVRMPDLRRLAKRVAKGMTAADAAAMYGHSTSRCMRKCYFSGWC
jgi:L-arabinose isomerase